ncbi:MAG: prephenate dehydrogenase [Gemmatimonadales bacterium]
MLNETEPRRAAIVGLGLIGGSMAARLRRARPAWTLVGHDIDRAAMDAALAAGHVHAIEADLEAALRHANVVVLATPVGVILELIGRLETLTSGDVFVIDVGSTKSRIVEAMGSLPKRIQSVGGHPMTGAVTAGVAGPNPDLFVGRRFVVTPTPTTRPETLEAGIELVRALDADVVEMGAVAHDAAVARVSHLPYLMAVPLLAAFAQWPDLTRSLAAGGFKSRAKGAGANVPMWWDILRTNRSAIREALQDYRTELDRIADLLEHGSDDELRALLLRARQAADRLS